MPKRIPIDRAELLALALAEGTRINTWAIENGVSVRSAYRLAEKPWVRERAKALRCQAIDRAVGKLGRCAEAAVVTLAQLLGADRPDMVKLGAARAILSALIDVRTHAELGERVAALEAGQVTKAGKRGKS